MSEMIRNRNEISEEYKWDLSTLFKSDEEFEKALGELDPVVEEIGSYRGKLNDAGTIRTFFDRMAQIERKVSDIYCYASLRRSEDTTDDKAKMMFGKVMSKYVVFASAVAFADPEILSLSKEKLNELVEDELLSPYRFNLEKLIQLKDHTLSSDQEELLANFAEVMHAPGEISENLMDADMVFEPALDEKGESHELTGLNFVFLENSSDRTLRENVFRNFYRTYKEHNNTLASTYSAAVKAEIAEAKVRHYSDSREMDMMRSNIPVDVYDRLVDTVHKHLPSMHRYVRLRKRLLKVDELHFYDIYTPLVSSKEKNYTYEEAQELILDALSVLGKDYIDTVRSAFKNRWIDVYPNKGKRGGAFSSGTYDSNPYILTNFTGTLDSVSTIAHEMGHSMHTYLANSHQPSHYADYTLFVAEVASTVNENLLIEKLLKEEKDPEQRLSLLNQYLENFKGTVYRQTMFAEFEKEAHRQAEQGETLTPAMLNELYERLNREYFGEDMFIDEEIRYEWSRIPHFYRPFYVYVYATGYSTAVALSEKILSEGEPAVKKYLEFLSMGGSTYPLDELRHAGVDLTTPEPIDTALNKFARVLDEAEKIADELGL